MIRWYKAVDAEVHGDPDNHSIDTRRYPALRINCAQIRKSRKAAAPVRPVPEPVCTGRVHMCTRVRLYARGTGVQWLSLVHIVLPVCIITSYFKRSKRLGLTNKFYTYALAWKKTGLHAGS